MRTVRLALRHPIGHDARRWLRIRLLRCGVRGADGLRQARPRRRVLPQRRARLRAGDRARPRQSFARREEPPGRRGRAARARLRQPQDRLYPRRRAAARLERDHRGHHRRHPVRVRRLAHAPPGARDHGCDPRQDRRHPRHPGRGDGAARRPADRQADPGAARRARPGGAAGGGQEGRGHPRGADDIRDLDDGQPLPGIDWKIEVDKAEAAKYGAGVSTVGSAVQLVTNGLKATEYRPVDSDKSVDILVRFRPTGAASTRSTICACRRRWATCRSAISSSACRRRASATSTASTATA